MRNVLYTLFFLLFACAASGQQTIWLGEVDSDWSNPANWSSGVPTSGITVIIPEAPNSPVFSGSPVITYPIQIAGSLTFNDFVYLSDNISVFASGTITTNGQVIIPGGQVLDIDGTLDNYGVFENYGMLDLAASATFINRGIASFTNLGEVLAFGSWVNNGTLQNNGSFNSIKAFTNRHTFVNAGTFESQFGSTFRNLNNGTITNENGASLSVNGTAVNRKSIINNGDFIVQNASVFNNDSAGTITNNDEMQVAGQLTNNGTIVNQEALMINSIGRLDNNNTLTNNGTIEIEICGNLAQLNTGNIAGPVQNDGNVYEINGTVSETNLEFGNTFSDLTERPAPAAACKKDAFLQIPESGVINFTAADIEKGRSYGNCGATIESVTISPTSFTSADVGVQIVTITVTDNFGNSASCDDFVTVLPYTPPIVPVDDPDIDFDCPQDVTVLAESGAAFAVADFPTPDATTTCSPAIFCDDTPNPIDGLDFLGQHNGSNYYVSLQTTDWHTANDIATQNGGYLVTIENGSENDFILHALSSYSGSFWTGLNSIGNPANYTWANGSNATYRNWQSGEPNITNNEAGVRFRKDNGHWTDRPLSSEYYFIIEKECIDTHINGYEYLGEFDGSLYYLSNNSTSWNTAANAAENAGGYIITVNNQAENDFITNLLNISVWTGYNNNDNGNNFVWRNGENSTYNNWRASTNEPNETSGFVAARLVGNDDGQWTDRNVSGNSYRHILEMPLPGGTGSSAATVTQIGGPPSGSNFPLGQTEVAFEVTDVCGNREVCQFTIDVVENPATLSIAGCPSDIVLDTEPGAPTVLVSWDEPTGTSDCYLGGPVTVDQVAGFDNNTAFEPGTSQIAYAVFDSCGNFEPCVFNVTVNAVPSQLEILDCPTDITVAAGPDGNAVVNWTEPTVSSNCYIDGSRLTQLQGPANGSSFPTGTTQIIYFAADDCVETDLCIFNVTVVPCEDMDSDGICAADDCDDNDANLPAAPGTACDDGNASTINDVIQADGCTCEGTLVQGCNPGNPCDDGDACTTGDTWDNDCNCVGIDSGDADNDGVCAAEDCNDSDATVPAAPGTACDDGNANTADDVIQADGCSCAGTPTTGTPDCETDIVFTTAPGQIIVSGLDNAPLSSLSIYSFDYSTAYFNCFADCDATVTVDLPAGSYPVFARFYGADYTETCLKMEVVTVTGTASCTPGAACNDNDDCTTNDSYDDNCNCVGTPLADSDNDGLCDAQDCAPNNDQLPGTPGTACNDNNADTENDVIQADGCTCAGTPINTGGCNPQYVLSPGNITVTGLTGEHQLVKLLDMDNGWVDVVNCFDNCPTPASFDLPPGNYYLQIIIMDGAFQTICSLDEAIVITENDGECTPGAACNDGDACTENDVYDDNCNCAGTLTDSDNDSVCDALDCAPYDDSLPAAQGTACDDGNANTENDVIGADGCSCAGTPIGNGDCDPQATTNGGSIVISGLTGQYNAIQIFDTSRGWNQVANCYGDCFNQEIPVQNGDYFVRLKVIEVLPSGGWVEQCENTFDLTITGSMMSIVSNTEVLHFDALLVNQQVQLQWVNNTEYKTSHFIVERSDDGENFGRWATFQPSNGETDAITNYQEADQAPALGENYYRLVQVFEDGNTRTSAIRKVDFDIDLGQIGIFPNPATDAVHINLQAYEGRRATIQIYNPLGVVMDQLEIEAVRQAPYRFNIQNYEAGLFTVGVKVDKRKRIAKRFIKVKK